MSSLHDQSVQINQVSINVLQARNVYPPLETLVNMTTDVVFVGYLAWEICTVLLLKYFPKKQVGNSLSMMSLVQN
jgi:hypothetical protein